MQAEIHSGGFVQHNWLAGKPSWRDAPEWAKWLSMDANGQWYWWEGQPRVEGTQWIHHKGGRIKEAGRTMCITLPIETREEICHAG